MSERGGREPAFTRGDLAELDALRDALPRSSMAGYQPSAVDAFLDRAMGALRTGIDETEGLRARVDPKALWFGHRQARLTAADVVGAAFPVVRIGKGYRMRPVDELLDRIADALSGFEAERGRLAASPGQDTGEDRPPRFRVEPGDPDPSPPAWLLPGTSDDPSRPGARFASVRRGYDTDQVDTFLTLVERWIRSLERPSPGQDEVRDGPTSDHVRRREFATARRGYDPDQVRDRLIELSSKLARLEPRDRPP